MELPLAEAIVRRIDRLESEIAALRTSEFMALIAGDGAPGESAAEGVGYWDYTNDQLYINSDGATAWQSIGGGGGAVAHQLLSSTHSDVTPAAVQRGDLIVGQLATPAWQRLALGTTGQVLHSDGTDAAWATLDHGELAGLGDDDHGAVYPGYAQAETITGLWTFDRDPGAPFAVSAGSAVVTNLDADLLDGLHAASFSQVGHTHDHGALTGLSDDDHGAVYPGYAQTETITGLWTFDRDPSAPFAVSAGSAVVTNLDADMLDGSHAASFAAATHASRHILGGADEINGDQLDIDWNPSNYTPSTSPAEATSVDHLTAHLYGIDQALGDPNIVSQQHVTLVAGVSSLGGTSYQDAGGDFYYDMSTYATGSGTWRVTLKSDSAATAYAELYDLTAASQVAEVSTASTSYTHLSAAVTLTNGHWYRVRLKSSGGASYAHCLGCYIKW